MPRTEEAAMNSKQQDGEGSAPKKQKLEEAQFAEQKKDESKLAEETKDLSEFVLLTENKESEDSALGEVVSESCGGDGEKKKTPSAYFSLSPWGNSKFEADEGRDVNKESNGEESKRDVCLSAEEIFAKISQRFRFRTFGGGLRGGMMGGDINILEDPQYRKIFHVAVHSVQEAVLILRGARDCAKKRDIKNKASTAWSDNYCLIYFDLEKQALTLAVLGYVYPGIFHFKDGFFMTVNNMPEYDVYRCFVASYRDHRKLNGHLILHRPVWCPQTLEIFDVKKIIHMPKQEPRPSSAPPSVFGQHPPVKK